MAVEGAEETVGAKLTVGLTVGVNDTDGWRESVKFNGVEKMRSRTNKWSCEQEIEAESN